MGKKRKVSSRNATEETTSGFEPRGGKLKAFTTYEDLADSEDEFHIQRDKVMLDEGPDTKRRKRWEDEELEPSDEEILGYDSESESDKDEESEEEEIEHTPRPRDALADDTEGEDVEEAEEGEEGWGTSKKDYYDADEIQTEADALEEEAEAKRLQQRRLQKMSEADFGFDESEWLNTAPGSEDEDVITEVLKDVEITRDMPPEERLRILKTKYPEFEFLANELLGLQPEFEIMKAQAKGDESPIMTMKCRALAAYVSSLTMYFAILTSPAKGAEGQGKTMDPAELRDHPVMDSILQCRELWAKVKDIKTTATIEEDSEDIIEDAPEANGTDHGATERKPKKKSKKELRLLAAAEEASTLRKQKMLAAEEELQELSSLIPKARKASKKTRPVIVQDSDSDFGEETSMDAKAAAEKDKKKKSLRFYTSQITQKANKRTGAGRDAGGDEDLPHRERLRDRQARLNAEAEKRGQQLDSYGRGGAALGGADDSGDDEIAAGIREEGDEYYNLIVRTSQKKKEEKAARNAAIQQAKAEGGLVRVVEGEVDEDGKRAIGYVIQKNKGLAPKRKKDVRNPRVKKRKKFEEKKKKLASTRAVYKGGEERGGYGGEKTGIKSGLVKSIKL